MKKEIFSELKKRYDKFISSRRRLIKEGSDVLSFSKQAIFAYQRGDLKGGDKLLAKAERILKNIDKKFIAQDYSLLWEGSLRAAQEEFVEAFFLQKILKGQPFSFVQGIEINLESYFGGLCDVIGELSRKSTNSAAQGQDKEVFYFKQQAEDIMEELVKFNFTGYLRTKYDQAKRSLKKIEEIFYDINIRRRE